MQKFTCIFLTQLAAVTDIPEEQTFILNLGSDDESII